MTSKAQRHAVKVYTQRKQQEGYKRLAVMLSPQAMNKLNMLAKVCGSRTKALEMLLGV